jgi:hypothetical protein
LGILLLEVVALLEILDQSGGVGRQPSMARVRTLEAGASMPRNSSSQLK